MRLYNTLSKSVNDIAPLEDDAYRIYSCGPTVYDSAHIGNLSAYIYADTLRRALNKPATHVMNYTDVDDKTIRRSSERYPDLTPREALRKLTDEYIELFRYDMAAVGNDLNAIRFIRATDTIDGMTRLISDLHADGYAYVADDGVYFNIEKYRASGKIYGQLVKLTTANTSNARINNDEYDKDSVHDFALWKTSKPGEPSWPFSLEGKDLAGRPGWHIECSVMSRQGLGQPFDIHTGGVDLQFPHHENEIAQSTALEHDSIMAKTFVHNDHILVDGKKMAKSANNFYTLQNIVTKQFQPLAFRLLVLQSHYRNPVNFTWESMQGAQNRLNDIRAMADRRFQPQPGGTTVALDELVDNIRQALANDIDTPQALAALSRFENLIADTALNEQGTEQLTAALEQLDKMLGLHLCANNDISAEQKAVIAQRQVARDAKDWPASDALRDELAQQGIGLRDTSNGQTWYRL